MSCFYKYAKRTDFNYSKILLNAVHKILAYFTNELPKKLQATESWN